MVDNIYDNIELFDIEDSIIDYLIVLYILRKGIVDLEIGGSRISGKTFFVVKFIIIDMLINRHSSWVVLMWEKHLNIDRTMVDFEKLIISIDDKINGFRNLFEIKKDKTKPTIIFKRSKKHNQIISFIGQTDLDSATLPSPPNTYWTGIWFEEVSGIEEVGGIKEESQKKMVSDLIRFRSGIVRSSMNLENKGIVKRYDEQIFIKTFNPYNNKNLILKDYMEYDIKYVRLEDLMTRGLVYKIDYEKGKAFITTNWLINPFVNKEVISYLLKQYKANPKLGMTEVFGKAGAQTNSVYEDVWHKIEKNERIFKFDKDVYVKEWRIGIDIGEGSAETAMLISAFQNGKSFVVDGIGRTNTTGYGFEELFKDLVAKIRYWEKTLKIEGRRIVIRMDYNKLFKEFLEKRFVLEEQREKFKNNYVLELAQEKYVLDKHDRSLALKYLITNEKLIFGNVSKLKDQFKLAQFEEDKYVRVGRTEKRVKAIKDGNDDWRNALEILLFPELKEVFKFIKDKNYDTMIKYKIGE